MAPVTMPVFRCDHMRLIVKLEDGWHHVNANTGVVTASKCTAGKYREPATLPENWGSVLDYAIRESDGAT